MKVDALFFIYTPKSKILIVGISTIIFLLSLLVWSGLVIYCYFED